MIFFWMSFEQAGSSLTLFADNSTDRLIPFLNWEMPASYFQSVNPLAVISPAITYRESDFVSGTKHFYLTHDFLIFDTNDSSSSYRAVEDAAFRIRNIFHRLNVNSFNTPSGYRLLLCLADYPIPGATDDLIKVSRVVQLTFDITEE